MVWGFAWVITWLLIIPLYSEDEILKLWQGLGGMKRAALHADGRIEAAVFEG